MYRRVAFSSGHTVTPNFLPILFQKEVHAYFTQGEEVKTLYLQPEAKRIR